MPGISRFLDVVFALSARFYYLTFAISLLVAHTNPTDAGRNWKEHARKTLMSPDVVVPWRARGVSAGVSPWRVSNLDHGCVCNADPPSGCPAESVQGSVWK